MALDAIRALLARAGRRAQAGEGSAAQDDGAAGVSSEAQAVGAVGKADTDGAGTLGKAEAAPAHEVAAAPEAATAEPEATPAHEAAPSPWDETDVLILRSNDVIASLADLVRHGDAPTELHEAVERTGLLSWKNAPRAEAKRLRRSGQWRLWADDGISDEAYDQMVATELALNLADDIRYGVDCLGDDAGFGERAEALLRAVLRMEPLGIPDEATSFFAQGAEEGGEWAARLSLAEFAQSLPTPLRVDMELQVNVADGIAVADIEVPRPDVFACVSGDASARAAHARSYAMRLCLALGRGAFGASGRIERVVVNGHEHGTRTPVISVDLTAGGLERLAAEVADAPTGELPRGLGIRWFASADGQLCPVDPFMAVWDEGVAPLSRWSGFELTNKPVSDSLAKATKANTYDDLAINEKSVRIKAWNEATGWLGYSTRRAVAAFEARRRRATDLTVADACERVSRALVSGDVDVFDRQSMALLFVEGGELTRAVTDVACQLNARPGHTEEELVCALRRLDEALGPAQQTARYEDDTRNVFRFFNSVPERIVYNQTVDDHGRELRLVPDEYYAAHTQATVILTALGRHEEALAHANELVRVAPVTPDATLTRVRVLEELSRIYEAEAALKEAIGFASCLHDLAVCVYRLAFMEWKLGRGQLSVACYQRAAELHSSVRERAVKELRDVLRAGDGLHRMTNEEAHRAILDAGLPLGDVERIRTMARDAAVACADAGLLGAARPLVGVLLEAEQDDVLMDVYGSLVPVHPGN
ncbi:tetratricopeptide repeat protein [Paratractidigestivibacter sp.]|uniref:tetratricopeptide repeat protein n=1 Tax=Paratractidigestivibacter sp. TaxID=2847316 RepID=UPI002ABD6065|nr:tetratricopeptide repeat protein [Paratractidigestivibacter sp.]